MWTIQKSTVICDPQKGCCPELRSLAINTHLNSGFSQLPICIPALQIGCPKLQVHVQFCGFCCLWPIVKCTDEWTITLLALMFHNWMIVYHYIQFLFLWYIRFKVKGKALLLPHIGCICACPCNLSINRCQWCDSFTVQRRNIFIFYTLYALIHSLHCKFAAKFTCFYVSNVSNVNTQLIWLKFDIVRYSAWWTWCQGPKWSGIYQLPLLASQCWKSCASQPRPCPSSQTRTWIVCSMAPPGCECWTCEAAHAWPLLPSLPCLVKVNQSWTHTAICSELNSVYLLLMGVMEVGLLDRICLSDIENVNDIQIQT